MLIYKCGLFVLPATFLLTLCTRVSNATKFIDFGLVLLYITSGVIAGKIIYERYQQVHNLSSSMVNTNVTSFANKISSFAAFFLFLGFLLYMLLFYVDVDNYCLTALNIFICGFGTLYIWMQCIITNYVSSLYYNKNVLMLRQWLGSLSVVLLTFMAVFGVVSIFLPTSDYVLKSGSNICYFITCICSYILAAIFSVFLLSFEVDSKYLIDSLESNSLLDDSCSFNNPFVASDSRFINEPSTIIIKGSISSMKAS